MASSAEYIIVLLLGFVSGWFLSPPLFSAFQEYRAISTLKSHDVAITKFIMALEEEIQRREGEEFTAQKNNTWSRTQLSSVAFVMQREKTDLLLQSVGSFSLAVKRFILEETLECIRFMRDHSYFRLVLLERDRLNSCYHTFGFFFHEFDLFSPVL
jgi:hypothetical protein